MAESTVDSARLTPQVEEGASLPLEGGSAVHSGDAHDPDSPAETSDEVESADESEAVSKVKPQLDYPLGVSVPDRNIFGDRRYCLLVTGVALQGLDRLFPDPALWTRQIMTMGFKPYLGNLLTEALPIGRSQAVLFCGRRSFGEGLTHEDALHLVTVLPPRLIWVGQVMELRYEDLPLLEGRQRLALYNREMQAQRPPVLQRSPRSLFATQRAPFGGYNYELPGNQPPVQPRLQIPVDTGSTSPVRMADTNRRGARLITAEGVEIDLPETAYRPTLPGGPNPVQRFLGGIRSSNSGPEQLQPTVDPRSMQMTPEQPIPPPVVSLSQIPAGVDLTQVQNTLPTQPAPPSPKSVKKIAGSRRKVPKKKSSRHRSHTPPVSGDESTVIPSVTDSEAPSQCSTNSRHRRYKERHAPLSFNTFDATGPDVQLDFENLKIDIAIARADHSDEKILGPLLKALKKEPGNIARQAGSEDGRALTLAIVLEALEENYGDLSTFVTASRTVATLTLGEDETIRHYGARVTTHANRLFRKCPDMTEAARMQTKKEAFYWGLPQSYKNQLAHFKDDQSKYQELTQAARVIEERLAKEKAEAKNNNNATSAAGSTDKPKAEDNKAHPTNPVPRSTFHKTRHFPLRHTTREAVASRSANPVDEEVEDQPLYEESVASLNGNPTLEQIKDIVSNAVRTGLNQSGPGKIECYVCGENHLVRDCHLLSQARRLLTEKGFLGKKGDSTPKSPSTSVPAKGPSTQA